jgi:MinD superfamily P-loop ATPase
MATLINPGLCIRCGVCVTECPQGAIEENFIVTQSKCDDCGECLAVCPTMAFFDCPGCPVCPGICEDGPVIGFPKMPRESIFGE